LDGGCCEHAVIARSRRGKGRRQYNQAAAFLRRSQDLEEQERRLAGRVGKIRCQLWRKQVPCV